mmetsp:Transcript_53280/g.124811  ORF Transcript_53280/g.124811 Transcript_53280/m.124811 type:complete len:164 (+) Transcript_53280:89-580(+)
MDGISFIILFTTLMLPMARAVAPRILWATAPPLTSWLIIYSTSFVSLGSSVNIDNAIGTVVTTSIPWSSSLSGTSLISVVQPTCVHQDHGVPAGTRIDSFAALATMALQMRFPSSLSSTWCTTTSSTHMLARLYDAPAVLAVALKHTSSCSTRRLQLAITPRL